MASDQKPAKAVRKRRWSWWKIALVLAVAAGAVYAFVARPWEPKPAEVAVEIVAPGPFTQVLAVNGRVVAREAVAVRSSVSGQAVQVLAAEGDTIAAGDVLVELDAAQARSVVDQAQANLDAGIARRAQAQATADRAIALGENAPRASREDAELALAAANNEVSRLQAALDQARSQLDQYTIRAPLDGIVLTRSVERGQLVDPQSELFTVADLSQLLVETDVDELYSARISDGLPVLLNPVGSSVPQRGSVVFAAPTVDPATGGRAIKIAFDEPVDLPVGLTVNANVIVSEVEDALTIPRGAIETEGPDTYVMVVEDGVAVRRPIEFSDWPAERVIVTEGLSQGEVVILDPTAADPGQTVVAE